MPQPTDVVPDLPASPRPRRRTSSLAIWSLVLALGPLALAFVVAMALGRTPASSPAFYQVVGLFLLGSYVASVATGIIAVRRIRRSGGNLKGIGLVTTGFGITLLVFVVGAVGIASTGDELFRDDFEGAQNFWTGEDAAVSETYHNGAYEIFIKDPSVPQTSRSWFTEPSQQALSFQADAVIVRGPEEDMAIGLGCFESKTAGYGLFVGPAGDFAIVDDTGVLTKGSGRPLLRDGQTNRISITCEGGGGAPTVLQLSVNGEKVARFEDADGYDSFDGIGFGVATSQAGTLVRFDNALAERI